MAQRRAEMTLEQFAKSAGVVLTDCDNSWGGKIAFYEKDQPNSLMCGFRSNSAAYKRWLSDTFGLSTGKAVMKLLRASAKGSGIKGERK